MAGWGSVDSELKTECRYCDRSAPETNAIFANVQAVKDAIQPPDTLEISVDPNMKVNEGDYARGGKNPDGFGRPSRARAIS